MSPPIQSRPGKAPIYRCDECGERLHMTLTGAIICVNCRSITDNTNENKDEPILTAPITGRITD